MGHGQSARVRTSTYGSLSRLCLRVALPEIQRQSVQLPHPICSIRGQGFLDCSAISPMAKESCNLSLRGDREFENRLLGPTITFRYMRLRSSELGTGFGTERNICFRTTPRRRSLHSDARLPLGSDLGVGTKMAVTLTMGARSGDILSSPGRKLAIPVLNG
jgi:hypothetical protein